MKPDQPNLDATETTGPETGLSPVPSKRAATTLQDAIVASLQGDLSGAVSTTDETPFSQEDFAGVSSQLAERGIDLGSLLGTLMAGAGQAKPKPKPRPNEADAQDDPATLMGKLAESLGLSPEALANQLGPILKKMLAGQTAASESKPRRKPKKDSAKPAAKPKPKPASKPKKDTAKPTAKSKPKAASKPKKDTAKPSAKPKPKPASKPKKDSAKPTAKPKPKTTR
jgi:hypothetical protein